MGKAAGAVSDRPCNYCNYEMMKRHARQDKQRLVVMPSDPNKKYYLGGVEVYRFPKSQWTTAEFKALKPAAREHWWVCWFMALPDHCCC